MPIAFPPRLAACFAITFALACACAAAADDVLTVRLASGRQFSGAVDDRTDTDRLWLRYGGDGITVVRPILWDRLQSATHNNQDVPLGELRKLAETIKTKEPRRPMLNQPPKPIEKTGGAQGPNKTYAQRARAALGAAARIRTVRFDAFLANWDGDVEADGLVIRVFPQANGGELSRVNGMVYVDLVALTRKRFQDAPRAGGAVPTRIGSWVRRFSSDQITNSGLEIRLPFQAIHPEFDSNVDTHGLVQVRLVVPGHGVFEHSQDAVRIRPFSPLRDHLERNGHGRFLPGETLGRTR